MIKVKLPQWSRKYLYKHAIQDTDNSKEMLYIKKPKCLMCTFLTNDKRDLQWQNRRKLRKIEDLQSEMRKMRTRCALNEHCIKCLKEPTYTFFIRTQITKIESQLKNLTNVLTGDKSIGTFKYYSRRLLR